MIALVAFVGLTGSSCCLWFGVIHATIDDVVEREGGWEALEQRDQAPPWIGEDLEEVRRNTPTTTTGPPRRTGLLPEEDIPPQEGLVQHPEEPLPSLTPPPAPDDAAPPQTPATPSEGELFGF